MPNVPNPGSDEAIAMQCTCPVLDNGHGNGILWDGEEGGPFFWISEDCPLHGAAHKESSDDT